MEYSFDELFLSHEKYLFIKQVVLSNLISNYIMQISRYNFILKSMYIFQEVLLLPRFKLLKALSTQIDRGLKWSSSFVVIACVQRGVFRLNGMYVVLLTKYNCVTSISVQIPLCMIWKTINRLHLYANMITNALVL